MKEEVKHRLKLLPYRPSSEEGSAVRLEEADMGKSLMLMAKNECKTMNMEQFEQLK